MNRLNADEPVAVTGVNINEQTPEGRSPIIELQGQSSPIFSADCIDDPVVILALFKGMVQINQVEKAWRKWLLVREMGLNPSLWWVLAEDPQVDKYQIYQFVEQVQSFNRSQSPFLFTDPVFHAVANSEPDSNEGIQVPILNPADHGEDMEEDPRLDNDPAQPVDDSCVETEVDKHPYPLSGDPDTSGLAVSVSEDQAFLNEKRKAIFCFHDMADSADENDPSDEDLLTLEEKLFPELAHLQVDTPDLSSAEEWPTGPGDVETTHPAGSSNGIDRTETVKTPGDPQDDPSAHRGIEEQEYGNTRSYVLPDVPPVTEAHFVTSSNDCVEETEEPLVFEDLEFEAIGLLSDGLVKTGAGCCVFPEEVAIETGNTDTPRSSPVSVEIRSSDVSPEASEGVVPVVIPPASTVTGQDIRNSRLWSDVLKDDVVVALLKQKLVSTEQVERVWQKWKQEPDQESADVLWWLLAKEPDIAREQVYAVASQVFSRRHGIPIVPIPPDPEHYPVDPSTTVNGAPNSMSELESPPFSSVVFEERSQDAEIIKATPFESDTFEDSDTISVDSEVVDQSLLCDELPTHYETSCSGNEELTSNENPAGNDSEVALTGISWSSGDGREGDLPDEFPFGTPSVTHRENPDRDMAVPLGDEWGEGNGGQRSGVLQENTSVIGSECDDVQRMWPSSSLSGHLECDELPHVQSIFHFDDAENGVESVKFDHSHFNVDSRIEPVIDDDGTDCVDSKNNSLAAMKNPFSFKPSIDVKVSGPDFLNPLPKIPDENAQKEGADGAGAIIVDGNRPIPDSEVASTRLDKEFTLEQWLSHIGLEWEPRAASEEPSPSLEDVPILGLDNSGFSTLALRDRVTIMLLFKERVRIEQVEKAWVKWNKINESGQNEFLWRVLAQEPGVDSDLVYAEAAEVYAFRKAQVSIGEATQFIRGILEEFSETIWNQLKDMLIVPVGKVLDESRNDWRWIFATYDPTRPEGARLLHQLKLKAVELRYLPKSILNSILAEAFPRRNEYLERVSTDRFAYDLGTSFDKNADLVDEDALEAEIGRSALINLFEATLLEAVRSGASDIHIFPNARKTIEIHFRIDGELSCWHVEERVHPEAFLAVVKDKSMNVDRFERDAAQDGFIQRWVDDAIIRFRVSVLPIATTNHDIRAESIVIRVLDDRKVVTDLRKLGLSDREIIIFQSAISQPHGMVILTGPTGSGKSTTLFAALSQVVTPKVNVLTIEDPVEYLIPGVRQIKLNHKLGLEEALRSVLRHDPDIVMVGEMRDAPTADLAIKLSNTGHLTFSTLHTNDAPSAINRLYKMGIEPFLIAYSINLIVAQRLVRKLCPGCKVVDEKPDPLLLQRMGFVDGELVGKVIYKASYNTQCDVCKGAGYKGRQAITEMLTMTDSIRHVILMARDVVDEGAVRDAAIKEGMQTLQDSARHVVKEGLTSLSEMMRVVAGKTVV